MNSRALSVILLIAAIVALLFAVSQSQSLSQTQATLAAQLSTATAQSDALAQQATSAAALADAATQAADAQASALANAEEVALANRSTAVAEAEGAVATEAASTLAAAQDLNATVQAQAIATVEAEAATTQAIAIATVNTEAATAQAFAIATIEADAALEQEQTLATQTALEAALSEAQTAIALYATNAIPQSRSAEGGFILGNPDAPFTLVHFVDWACPPCQDYQPIIDRFVREFVMTGQAKYELYILPTAGGAETAFAAGIAECMNTAQPGAFWIADMRYHQLALSDQFANAPRIVADELNLDFQELLACETNSTFVEYSTAFAQTLNVSGTPAIRTRDGNQQPIVIIFEDQPLTTGGVDFSILRALVDVTQRFAALTATPDAPNVRLGTLVATTSVDRDGCPVGETDVFAPDDSIFAAMTESQFPANTAIFARMYLNGRAIEDTNEIVADRDYTAVFENNRGFEVGSYEIEIIINGNLVGSVAFEVR
jgi:protein-disulfide isomerase